MGFVLRALLPGLLLCLALNSYGRERYIHHPLRDWNVYFEKVLTEDEHLCSQVKAQLDVSLHQIDRALPAAARAALPSVTIWVDLEDARFPGCVYHPSPEWLREHGYDAEKAKSIHIANARNFLEWTHHQPAMILHELAHAYHDQVLGFDHPDLRQAYTRAQQSGKYQSVLLYNGTQGQAYALGNEQEYFAELTEAMYWVNDFYPFVRAEVQEYDPEAYELLRRLWRES
jgi:dipeptidyl-peptidase-4